MTIDGILFDMDGVLVDSEPFIREAAQEMFRRRFDFAMPDEAFTPFVGAGEDAFLGGPAKAHGLPIELPADKVLTYDIYMELIENRLGPLPGVIEFVATARSHGLKLAVCSAADRRKVVGNLRAIGLGEEAFDTIITGDDVSKKKPDPEGYLMAASGIGIPGSKCLVVEDAVNGIKAGCAAGAACLGLTTSFDSATLVAAGATATASNLAEVSLDIRQQLGLWN